MGNIYHMSNKGFTIIDSIFAILFMLIAVLAGGAFIYHSGMRINIESDKRTAIEVANGRLEEMRAASYDNIKPATNDGNLHYIQRPVGGSLPSDTDPNETININGHSMDIKTTVQYVDLDGSLPPDDFDYLQVIVTVYYRGTAESVTLTTYISPR